ncbi:EamA family transporter RarD [Sporosarcina highlanderae]|uniref:EamA family transporter RarD n=1 Tax=Sporosarcina highlanderae TaxID=3035916 RepID=A0ABT8JS99_9BACL|nr:EamA family transporter RarD [Sporosarcina highlanderae]MDN4607019.1 EamA family transporter RarD [Sporosarcina highlanderae]
MQTEKSGVLWVAGSFVLWGVMPIYWKHLSHVQSDEILTGRIMWAFFSTLLLIVILRNGKQLVQDVRELWKKQFQFWSLFIASVLVTSNWFIYIWAVNNNYIVQTSLGYYINPLVSVLLGIFFLKEKLSSMQKIAFLLATSAVIILTISYGKFPWISLSLAITFAVYGFIKKRIQLDSLRGLAIETLFMTPFAIGYYILLFTKGQAVFLHLDSKTDILLILTGIATALPLVMYAKGVQMIPLYVSGFFQYIAPTMMLFLGVVVYKEAFSVIEMLSFSIIWAALILFTISKVYESISMKRNAH